MLTHWSGHIHNLSTSVCTLSWGWEGWSRLQMSSPSESYKAGEVEPVEDAWTL